MKNTFLHIIITITVLAILGCKNDSSVAAESHSLYRAYQSHFRVGAALNYSIISKEDIVSNAILEQQFNSITPENTMKWMHIHPFRDSFYFDHSDAYTDLGTANDQHVVGHTLIWHSQLAPWVSDVKDSLQLTQVIDHHIDMIAGRYKGKIQEWDVVNEALNEDGSYRESHFFNILGTSYLKQAFQKTSEVDPNVKLVYNDYNLWKPSKRQGVTRLINMLKQSDIKIDGVGMQGHYGIAEPSLEDIEQSIIAFSNLGVKVNITELDINTLPFPKEVEGAEVEADIALKEGMNPYKSGLPDSIQLQLDQRYIDLFKLFLKHEDKIDRVTLWGISDDNSWLNNWPVKGRTNYPLLYDANKKPKAVIEQLISLTHQ